MSEWLMLAIGVVLTIGTGLFVASEFALVNLDRNELERRRETGEKNLGPTISALKITSTHLSSAQLGITLTTLLTGYTTEPAISSLLGGPLTSWGLPSQLVPVVGGIVAIVAATLFSMVIGELVPKNFALAVPLATARLVVPFQTAFTAIFKPMILLLNNTANACIRRMGIEPKEELSGARSAEELSYLIAHSASEGALEIEEARLLDRSLSFVDRDANDMMTPRTQMETVERGATATEVLELACRTGFSRMPVTGEGADDIVGLLHVKQAFAVGLAERDHTTAEQLMVEPLRLPESLPAPALLEQLRTSGLQLAVLIDEYGGTAGIVTVEDLVEEIIGELHDEHDDEEPLLVSDAQSTTFDGSLRPDEVALHTGIVIPESEDWDTVGGFLATTLSRIPEVDDEVPVEGGLLRVDEVEQNRVTRVQFIASTDEGDDHE